MKSEGVCPAVFACWSSCTRKECGSLKLTSLSYGSSSNTKNMFSNFKRHIFTLINHIVINLDVVIFKQIKQYNPPQIKRRYLSIIHLSNISVCLNIEYTTQANAVLASQAQQLQAIETAERQEQRRRRWFKRG